MKAIKNALRCLAYNEMEGDYYRLAMIGKFRFDNCRTILRLEQMSYIIINAHTRHIGRIFNISETVM